MAGLMTMDEMGKKDLTEKHKKGGRVKRKAGGMVPGDAPAARPDRRARGGSIDVNPVSAAGKMTKMPYEANQQPAHDVGGKGPDSDIYKD
jgi:hypothetical protein